LRAGAACVHFWTHLAPDLCGDWLGPKFQSAATLATVVGMLTEVPMMLSVVQIVRRTRPWYEAGNAGERKA
jgi:hypothetical protein